MIYVYIVYLYFSFIFILRKLKVGAMTREHEVVVNVTILD